MNFSSKTIKEDNGIFKVLKEIKVSIKNFISRNYPLKIEETPKQFYVLGWWKPQFMMGNSGLMVTRWQKTDGCWKMTVDYHKPNQVVTPVLVAVSVLILLLDKMNTFPGT